MTADDDFDYDADYTYTPQPFPQPDGSVEWLALASRPFMDLFAAGDYVVRHRLDGPAVEWPDGTVEWYVDGWDSTHPDLCATAVDPDTDSEVLFGLCGHDDPVVRALAAANPNCAEEGQVWAELLDDGENMGD